MQLGLYYQLTIALFGSFIKASLLFVLLALFSTLFKLGNAEFKLITIISSIINFSVVFFVWNAFYFAYHYFLNYKRAEIDKFKLEAAQNESELNSLKSQLNPHFMFNSMNSIRALIDENPLKAKQAVTQLSNILRNSLLMNKNREIALEEEIQLVKDYLELEKIRYEERLNFELFIEPESLKFLIPPLIIQGQVENAIKHGISKMPKGGKIIVKTLHDEKGLNIRVSNTGKLNTEKSETGFGMKNTMQRLQLLYGKNTRVHIAENSVNESVEVTIFIPQPKTLKT